MFYPLGSNGTQNAAIDAVADDAIVGDLDAEPWMFSAPLANQIFSIVPGVAGGLAGFMLANRLARARAVSAPEVLMASSIVAIITFGSLFLIRTIEEF